MPYQFAGAKTILDGAGDLSSSSFLNYSTLMIGLSIFPWCICMGLTYPLVMHFMRSSGAISKNNFSFLYLANVIGAALGAFLTPFVLIESFGFQGSLWLGFTINFMVALCSFAIAQKWQQQKLFVSGSLQDHADNQQHLSYLKFPMEKLPPPILLFLLMITGFVSMASEVAWMRDFAPVLGTEVYSYALVLLFYLLATMAGTFIYRMPGTALTRQPLKMVLLLPFFILFPIIMNDWQLFPKHPFTVLLSIIFFVGSLGYVTPFLMDLYCQGRAHKVGWAYAMNTLGCVLGPLCSAYLLMPYLSLKNVLLILAFIYGLSTLYCIFKMNWLSRQHASLYGTTLLLLWVTIYQCVQHQEEWIKTNALSAVQVHRDATAITIAFGQGRSKKLLVNGTGTTIQTPITKAMAHLPLWHLKKQATSALVICFGMGTTFRSLLSWGAEVTAVELVPGVIDSFSFFHSDAADVLKNPRATVVIDDGRRFLNRTRQQYDVIVIDPPPPVEASGSSLLYTKEFYQLVLRHLKPEGIFQQWLPTDSHLEDKILLASFIRSLQDSFKHILIYPSLEGWGLHILASQVELKQPQLLDIQQKMPALAVADLLEWGPYSDLEQQYQAIMTKPLAFQDILQTTNAAMTDDKPYNEYYKLRRNGL